MLEILSDGLRGKARIPSSTVSSILEVRTTPATPFPDDADICQVVIDPETDIPTKQLTRYAEDGVFYLLSHTPTEHFAQADYVAAETVAKLITLLADKDLISLINIISGLHAEVCRPRFTFNPFSNSLVSAFPGLGQPFEHGISYFPPHSRPSRLLSPKSSSPISRSSSAVSSPLFVITYN